MFITWFQAKNPQFLPNNFVARGLFLISLSVIGICPSTLLPSGLSLKVEDRAELQFSAQKIGPNNFGNRSKPGTYLWPLEQFLKTGQAFFILVTRSC